ncbi:MAG: NAD(P)-dependent alcohol dehydrogenase [Anaerolineae bacterium]|nr:NAD(P)-dependent alcohol dehydrogenase [Anaerolineae bacterium]
MKAVVYEQYGAPEVLHVAEIAKPTPKDGEILVKVHAATVGFGDLIARDFKRVTPRTFNMLGLFWLMAKLSFGVNAPRQPILGAEFAGEVEAVGGAVTRFKVGDAVFGYRGQNLGAYAEYLCVPADGMVEIKPANLTYEEAAAIPYGALTALNLLRKVDIKQGQKVLINGASGGIGSAALQLAKHFGAHVTGVAATPRLDLMRALGADKVLDYTQDDFTKSGDSTYDVIFDILGRSSFARAKKALKPDGRFLLASFKLKQLGQMIWTSWRGGKRVICALSSEKPADLTLIKELVEAGTLKVIIDRCYPLDQAAAAHRHAESGNRRGSIVLSMQA